MFELLRLETESGETHLTISVTLYKRHLTFLLLELLLTCIVCTAGMLRCFGETAKRISGDNCVPTSFSKARLETDTHFQIKTSVETWLFPKPSEYNS